MGLRIGVFKDDEVVSPQLVDTNENEVKYVLEVIRKYPVVQEVERKAEVVDVVRPGGTVVNIGAGPELPENPYEGQVWILT